MNSTVKRFIISISSFLMIGYGTASAEELTGVVQEDFYPYTNVDGGKVVGLHAEIVSNALKKAGIDLKLQGTPWKRLVKMTDDNEIDLSFSWREKPERFEKYHMVGPVTKVGSRTYFWAKKGSGITWKDINDLKQYKIGAIDGYAYPAIFESNIPNLKVEKATIKTENWINKILAGRVDLFISDETVFGAEASKLKVLDQLEAVGEPVEVVNRYVALNKSRGELAAKIQKALDDYKETEEYKLVCAKYGIK